MEEGRFLDSVFQYHSQRETFIMIISVYMYFFPPWGWGCSVSRDADAPHTPPHNRTLLTLHFLHTEIGKTPAAILEN